MHPQPTSALALLLAGCGFTPGGTVSDAAPDARTIDAPVDANEQLLSSCAAIHLASPAKLSGSYVIDPDGSGPEPAITVTCDMINGDGGWTIIYLADTNVLTTPIAYQTNSPRLLADAQSAMLAYRDAARVLKTGTHYATFPLPTEWRSNSPFNYPGNDATVMVRIDNATPQSKTVRYGSQSFSAFCGDPWLVASPYGRLCIENTNAPFYVGFATPVDDNCSDSGSKWDTTSCDDNYRLSIAVR